MTRRGIFIAELDDDYQAAARLDSAALQRRIRCYYLLAPNLLIHPAYIWQAKTTHSLVTQDLAGLLLPPFTQFALGDSDSLQDYMQQRIGNLSGPTPTPELDQYLRWGGDLATQAAALDSKFGSASGVVFATSRDKMFRNLLRRDLSTDQVAGISLRQIIVMHMRSRGRSAVAERFIASLVGFVSGAPLVSLDSLQAFVVRRGFPQLARLQAFRARMLVLYYRSNVDDDYVVAGLPSLDPNDPTIHPYDPKLFWAVVEHIFGPAAVSTLADNPARDALSLLERLKGDGDWANFVSHYEKLRAAADSMMKQEAYDLARDLEIDTGYARLKLLPRVWREKKTELITSIIGLGCSGTVVVDPSILAVTGAGAGAASLLTSIRPIRRFRDEYELNSLRRLKRIIRRQMRVMTGKESG